MMMHSFGCYLIFNKFSIFSIDYKNSLFRSRWTKLPVQRFSIYFGQEQHLKCYPRPFSRGRRKEGEGGSDSQITNGVTSDQRQ